MKKNYVMDKAINFYIKSYIFNALQIFRKLKHIDKT